MQSLVGGGIKPATISDDVRSMSLGQLAAGAYENLADEVSGLIESILQWLSKSTNARYIDREIGALEYDVLGDSPSLSYVRYEPKLSADRLVN